MPEELTVAQLAAIRHTTVELARGSKGETKISVKVTDPDSDVANNRAEGLYDNLLLKYPEER